MIFPTPKSSTEALHRTEQLSADLEKIVNLQVRVNGKELCVRSRDKEANAAELQRLFEQYRIKAMKEKSAEVRFLEKYWR